jgi:hypothetical protein
MRAGTRASGERTRSRTHLGAALWACRERRGGQDGWTKTFTDPRLCAAIVDRLTFGGNIIETGTDSYRLAHTRAQHAATSS